MEDFSTRLRELRKKRGLRQVDLAEAFGLAQTTIANYEKKLRFPDEPLLVRFADYFSVSLDYLMGRSSFEREPEAPFELPERHGVHELSVKAREYLELLRANLGDAASELVESLAREGKSLGRIYLEVLEPALKETGRLWERGELRVGEEHSISLSTQRIMSRIFQPPAVTGRTGARPSLPPVCAILAVSGEPHVIGPTMVSDLLRMDGWEVLFPGGNLSIRHFLELVEEPTPQLIALSVTIAEHLSAAADLVSAVREKDRMRGVRILVGGQAFQQRPKLWQEIGADATAPDAESAVLIANKLVSRKTV